MHPNSALIFEKYAKNNFRANMKVLEIGPDAFPSTFQNIVRDKTITWDSLDIYESPNLTYSGVNEYQYPIHDNYYDIVVSVNVLEHVKKIWLWIKELGRVCKVGGKVITISPLFLEYHAHPVDCWRVFPDGMRVLYEEAQLDINLSIYDNLDVYNVCYTLSSMRTVSSKIKFIILALLKRVRFPIERSYHYDTITIGTKRGQTGG